MCWYIYTIILPHDKTIVGIFYVYNCSFYFSQSRTQILKHQRELKPRDTQHIQHLAIKHILFQVGSTHVWAGSAVQISIGTKFSGAGAEIKRYGIKVMLLCSAQYRGQEKRYTQQTCSSEHPLSSSVMYLTNL